MFEIILNGLAYGSLLVILASGLVLLYGLRGIVNFAHGSLYMMGAYIGATMTLVANFWVALNVAAVVFGLVGLVLDRTIFRLLQNRPPVISVIVTFGLLLVFEDIVHALWGKNNIMMDGPALFDGTVNIFGVSYPLYRLMMLAFGVALAAGLWAWLRFTRIGLFIRAASRDPIAAGICGVNADRVSGIVVATGTALAGVAGVIAGPMLSLSPTMGSSILVDSFVVVVLGGLGSFAGALVSGVLLGQVQSWGAVYVPSLAALLPFILMGAVLIWRPEGILGRKS